MEDTAEGTFAERIIDCIEWTIKALLKACAFVFVFAFFSMFFGSAPTWFIGILSVIIGFPVLLYWLILGPHIVHQNRIEREYLVHKQRLDWLKRRGWDKDWYAILGLDHTASIEEVKQASHDIYELCHPSKNSCKGQNEVMEAVSNARRTIRWLPVVVNPTLAEERLLPVAIHPQN